MILKGKHCVICSYELSRRIIRSVSIRMMTIELLVLARGIKCQDINIYIYIHIERRRANLHNTILKRFLSYKINEHRKNMTRIKVNLSFFLLLFSSFLSRKSRVGSILLCLC
jgi:hypothetical protein